jgi:type I restriction enzyme R subunit
VAKALDFDEDRMKKVITSIEKVKKRLPSPLRKRLGYGLTIPAQLGHVYHPSAPAPK